MKSKEVLDKYRNFKSGENKIIQNKFGQAWLNRNN
jgi:hypothetical protein